MRAPVVVSLLLCSACEHPEVGSFRAAPPAGAWRLGGDHDGPVEGSRPDDHTVYLGVGCEVERFRCQAGLVMRCDGGDGWALAKCTRGCASEVVFDDMSDDEGVALLCAR